MSCHPASCHGIQGCSRQQVEFPGREGAPSVPVMVPFACHVNHSPWPTVVRYGRVNPATDTLDYPAFRPCKQGHQVRTIVRDQWDKRSWSGAVSRPSGCSGLLASQRMSALGRHAACLYGVHLLLPSSYPPKSLALSSHRCSLLTMGTNDAACSVARRLLSGEVRSGLVCGVLATVPAHHVTNGNVHVPACLPVCTCLHLHMPAFRCVLEHACNCSSCSC